MAKDCKLLMLMPSFAGPGGIQRFNRALAYASSRYCSKIKIVSLTDTNDDLASFNASANTVLQGTDGKRMAFVAIAAKELVLGNWDVVVVGHINLVGMMVTLGQLRIRRSPIRTILMAHGIEIWNRIGHMRRREIARCWRIAAVSTYTRDSVLRQVPQLTSQQCVLFPNAIGQAWVNAQSSLQNSGTPLALPKKFILSVSRLASTEHYKGIISVIESLANLIDTDIHYVIAGKGDDVDFLLRVAERCGVASHVHIRSGLGDVALADLYHNATAFILPSGKEGFGIVYLEAMYFNLPVIAARAKGAVDVVVHEETGLLVEYGDIMGIANAIDRICSDSTLRNKLIESGKRLVTDEGVFTADAMTRRWCQILEQA